MPTFTAEQLKKIAVDNFERLDIPTEEAEIVADHLVEASLSGVDSHGVLRIPQYAEYIRQGRIVPRTKIEIMQETPSSASINGNNGFGQIVTQKAMELAIDKAKQFTISAVSVHNCSHTGRLGSYTATATKEDMIGIIMVNAGGCGQQVAPFGGIGRRLGTNPFSIAVPTGGEIPIVLDMATSMAPEGKLRDLHNKGEEVPEGWIIDSKGQPSTSTADFYDSPNGALLTFGSAVGHKGFGLSLIVDILAGGLSTAGCCRPDMPLDPYTDGVFICVIDIQKFTPLTTFYQQVQQLIEHVKSSPTASGFDRILVSGEPEALTRKKRLKDGIFVNDILWQKIQSIHKE
ncbi:TPA: Ldh family oxidoreductase [Candidatus Poribacteria bacterium]|nr:Ldh family oxidoreductase [Candidatus Poribacteria bacterium]